MTAAVFAVGRVPAAGCADGVAGGGALAAGTVAVSRSHALGDATGVGTAEGVGGGATIPAPVLLAVVVGVVPSSRDFMNAMPKARIAAAPTIAMVSTGLFFFFGIPPSSTDDA